MQWTREMGIGLCTAVEPIIAPLGFHVALTGGLLYKAGPRKDADLLFYTERQWPVKKLLSDRAALLELLRQVGIEAGPEYGWLVKAKWGPFNLDLFFPEWPRDSQDGDSNAVGRSGHADAGRPEVSAGAEPLLAGSSWTVGGESAGPRDPSYRRVPTGQGTVAVVAAE